MSHVHIKINPISEIVKDYVMMYGNIVNLKGLKVENGVKSIHVESLTDKKRCWFAEKDCEYEDMAKTALD